MKLNTDFNRGPYWDDYDVDKQFYKILFMPSLAVQVREINQMQTMQQQQVEWFADHQFKDGSIVDGCNITYFNEVPFARCEMYDIDDSTRSQFTTEALSNFMVVSDTTGLRASIRMANPGYVGTYPDTNILYYDILNTGRDTGDNPIVEFSAGEKVTIYTAEQDKQGPLDPGLIYNTVSIYTPRSVNQEATGKAYMVHVGDGVIYQKGYFIKVRDHTILVRKYDLDTSGMLVGFETEESIISHLQDNSLIDPVDTSNRSGIGANRLKLTPVLVAKHKDDVKTDDDFFPIIEFGKDTGPVKQNTDPEYNKLGDWVARGMHEQAGDYYVKPFIVGTKTGANNKEFRYTVDPGIGYVKGNRVQLIGAIELDVPRAIDEGYQNANIVTLNYGNYIFVEQLAGIFRSDKLVTVDLYDQAQRAVTNGTNGAAPVGTKVGSANVRAVLFDSGNRGKPNGKYRVYLTNINLNTGKSLATDVKSVVASSSNNSGYSAVADLVLENGRASLKESSMSGLVFDTGIVGTKRFRDPSDINDTMFSFKSSSTATLQANGSVTFTLNTPYAGGIERFFASTGNLSAANKSRLDIATTAAMSSENLPGTVNATSGNTTLTGAGTSFTTDLVVGEKILIDGTINKTITAIANNTSLTVDSNITGGTTTSNYAKFYSSGSQLDLTTANVTVVSNTQFIVDLGTAIAQGAPQTLIASYPVLRAEAVEMRKDVRRGTLVKLDVGSNPSEAMNLGLVDVFRVTNIWVGDSYSKSNPDRVGWFNLDIGQQLTHYDHAKISIKSQYRDKIAPGMKILVQVDHFQANNSTGIGYFSVDSYNVRQPDTVANTTNISYEDIPEVNGYNLRNCVDFRPQKINTATITTDIAAATINPAKSTNDFMMSSSGIYLGEPDSNFQADIEYYLPRYDIVQVNKDGRFSVKQGVSSQTPTLPGVDDDSMSLAEAFVPPFPALAMDETHQYALTKPRIKSTLTGNRGYTMRDINVLDKRISTLEYHQALSMLEQRAKDYTVKDENGLDRFKNGIFADPLKNHLLGDVSNFEYNIAIDEKNEIARPRIRKHDIDLDVKTLNNVKVSGRIATLDFTRETYINQPYATKFRNVTESVWDWTGSINLYPEYDHYQDEQTLPAVNVDVDLASPWEEFANSPFGQSYGDWRVTSSSQSSKVTGSTTTSSLGGGTGRTTTRTDTTISTVETTTTNVLDRDKYNLNVSSSQTKTDMGSYVTDITMNPYMRSRVVSFIATGLRPDTEMFIFFDREPVSANCAPGKINPTVYSESTGELTITQGQEDKVITRTGEYGDQLRTDSNGNLYGVFLIPDQKFRVGDRILQVADVNDIKVGADAIMSSAKTVYTASSITTSSRSMSITTTNPQLSTTTSTESRVESSTSVTSKVSTSTSTVSNPNWEPPRSRESQSDPLGQTFRVEIADGRSPGLFVNGIGVFFRKKDANLGITCYITELIAGVPDPSRVLAKSYLKPIEIQTSDDASIETIFNFQDIPYLTNDKSYAFFLMPDGNSPDYQAFMAEIGGIDMRTGVKIFSNPYIGDAVKSSNSESWDVLSTEDLTFNVYRCSFDNTSGEIELVEQDDEYLTTTGFTYTQEGVSVRDGDLVFIEVAGAADTSEGSPRAVVQSIDPLSDKLILDSSTGGFATNQTLRIYRPEDDSDISQINNSSLIATTKIVSVDNIEYSIIVPRVATTTPLGTLAYYSYKGMADNEIPDPRWTDVEMENEYEFTDKMRVIKSKSNRETVDNTSYLRVKLSTDSTFVSPVLDLRRRSLFAIENMINDSVENEHTRYGEGETKYISRILTLAEGQDAEDLKVFITGYRPADTEIHVYAKIRNASDPEDFYDKFWTKLDMIEGAAVRSSQVNTDDYREFGFAFPDAEAMQGTAWRDLASGGIVRYRNESGTIFETYKMISFKVVLSSTYKHRVPRIDDIRGIALQL